MKWGRVEMNIDQKREILPHQKINSVIQLLVSLHADLYLS
jgi:hypothetical protein